MEKFSEREQPVTDEETSAALETAMSTLPPDDLTDFLRLPDTDIAYEQGSGFGCVIFDCATRHGKLVPLKSSDRNHSLWQHILEVSGSCITPGKGLLLNNHLVLTMDGGVDHPARVVAISNGDILGALPLSNPAYSLTAGELRLLKQLL